MMNAEEGNTLYDVRNRLRHRSIQTTKRVYDHLLERWPSLLGVMPLETPSISFACREK
jgi:hypothetical protein